MIPLKPCPTSRLMSGELLDLAALARWGLLAVGIVA